MPPPSASLGRLSRARGTAPTSALVLASSSLRALESGLQRVSLSPPSPSFVPSSARSVSIFTRFLESRRAKANKQMEAQVDSAAKKKEEGDRPASVPVGQSPVAATTEAEESLGEEAPRKVWTEHKYSTANFKISRRKLQLLASQISGKPIDSSILQMVFSQKRASNRIKSTLCLARDHAVAKGLDREKLVVDQAWVTKGKYMKRMDIKGRGRVGMLHHPYARMHVLLKETKPRDVLREERKLEKRRRAVLRNGPGVYQLERKLINPKPYFTI